MISGYFLRNEAQQKHKGLSGCVPERFGARLQLCAIIMGFPGGSVDKESACSAGDYMQWRGLPAVQETWVLPLGQEDPWRRK